MSDLEFVQANLRECRGQWLRISREADVAHRAIYNIVRGLNDPRSSTVNKLAKWFRDQQAAEAAARAKEAA